MTFFNKLRKFLYALTNEKNRRKLFANIFHKLTNEAGGNVNDKGYVKVTSSSCIDSSRMCPKFAVDLDNKENYFESDEIKNSWLHKMESLSDTLPNQIQILKMGKADTIQKTGQSKDRTTMKKRIEDGFLLIHQKTLLHSMMHLKILDD